MDQLVNFGKFVLLMVMLGCVYMEAGQITVLLFMIVIAELYGIADDVIKSEDNVNIVLCFLDRKFKEFEVVYEDDETDGEKEI